MGMGRRRHDRLQLLTPWVRAGPGSTGTGQVDLSRGPARLGMFPELGTSQRSFVRSDRGWISPELVQSPPDCLCRGKVALPLVER